MKYILYFFLAYFAFQFIFRLVVPLFLAGRTLRKGFRQMKEQMEQQVRQQGGFSNVQRSNRPVLPLPVPKVATLQSLEKRTTWILRKLKKSKTSFLRGLAIPSNVEMERSRLCDQLQVIIVKRKITCVKRKSDLTKFSRF